MLTPLVQLNAGPSGPIAGHQRPEIDRCCLSSSPREKAADPSDALVQAIVVKS